MLVRVHLRSTFWHASDRPPMPKGQGRFQAREAFGYGRAPALGVSSQNLRLACPVLSQ